MPASARPGSTPATENSTCPLCDGIGWYHNPLLPVGHPQFGKMIPCECQAEAISARLRAACNLTETERQMTLDKIDLHKRPDTTRIVAQARQFIQSPVGMFTIWGNCGNAKTMVLQSIVNACIGNGIPALYVTFAQLLDWVREAYNSQAESVVTRKDRVATVRVLAIDEMDKVKHTEWVNEFETDILDRRYRLGLDGKAGTVLAMNESPEAALSQWIYSRLSDGRNVIMRNGDGDIRRYIK